MSHLSKETEVYVFLKMKHFGIPIFLIPKLYLKKICLKHQQISRTYYESHWNS